MQDLLTPMESQFNERRCFEIIVRSNNYVITINNLIDLAIAQWFILLTPAIHVSKT